MLSRCPFCQTVFQVNDSQLASAHGLVRCGQCQEVFDAGENTCEDTLTPVLEDKDTLSTEHSYDWQSAAETDSVAEDNEAGTGKVTKTQADWVIEHDDFLIPPETGDSTQEQTPAISAAPVEAADADTPDEGGGPGIDNNDIPLEIRDDIIARQTGPDRSFSRWFAGSLLLVIILGLQAVWFEHDALARNFPGARNWLNSFCQITGCKMALVSRPEKIQVISQEVRYHPSIKNAIQFNLTIANTADHEQPWPVIQLNLFNGNTGFKAMRRFTPADYLPDNNRTRALATDTPVTLSLNIIKPGKHVPDYVFSFLPPPAM